MTAHDTFMRHALAIAEANVRAGRGGPFGAVVVQGGAIVGEGANEVTSLNDPTAHAEIAAIRAACRALGTFRLEGCAIYASCEPCPMCLTAIYWARLDRIFYATTRADAARAGFDDHRFYDELSRPPGERGLPAEQLDLRGAQAPFEAWQAKADRIPY